MNAETLLALDRQGYLGMKNFYAAIRPAAKDVALEGYHALSTAPHAQRHPGTPFRMDESDLATAELSARLWRRFNGPIRLLTDPAGEAYVKSTPLAAAYDAILPVLDPRCCGIDPNKYWAAGKIAALSRIATPCAILDMDMIIWRPLDLAGEKLVCACVEFLNDTVYPPLSFFRTAEGYPFPPGWSEAATALNTAFLYMGDATLKADYTREAFRFMLAERETPNYWAVCMTFAEQRILGMCAEARGVYARLLIDMEPRGEIFTHIWGAKGMLRRGGEFRQLYLEICGEKLKQLREEDGR